MKIVVGYPPLYDRIKARFPHIVGREVFFCWGDSIFNPTNAVIPPELIEHECVHMAQQRESGPEAWWIQYIDDASFRLAQEIPAHRAEFLRKIEMYGGNRANRRKYLSQIAKRLSSPLYGSMISLEGAKKVISA